MLFPIPFVVRTRRVSLRPLASRVCGFELRRGARMPVSCECCVFCQVEVSATVRSLARRSPTERGVSECDLEASTVRSPRPTGGLSSHRKALPLWRLLFAGVSSTRPRFIPTSVCVVFMVDEVARTGFFFSRFGLPLSGSLSHCFIRVRITRYIILTADSVVK